MWQHMFCVSVMRARITDRIKGTSEAEICCILFIFCIEDVFFVISDLLRAF